MKTPIINTWNSGNSIFVKYLNTNGIPTTTKIKVNWYFAINLEDKEKASKLLSGYTLTFKEDPEVPGYTKIYCETINNIQDKYQAVSLLEKNGIETFEGDLLNDKLWYVNQDINIADNFRRLYFDIETDDSQEKIEIGRDRIVSYSAIDQDGKEYFKVLKDFDDDSEKKLLVSFLKLIKNYDIILGWNSSGFDIPYLKARMKLYDLHKTDDYCWKELARYDLLKRFRHIFRFDSHLRTFSLDFISNHFLGHGKIPHTESIMELYRTNQKKLKEYNIEDSRLVRELDLKLGVSDMMIKQCQWCGVPPSQFGLYSIIDTYILKTAHKVKKFAKTSLKAINERSFDNSKGNENPDDVKRFKKGHDEAKYIGAIVLDPKIGKYGRIYTFDYKGLYPSMMRTSNIGYDSLRYEANDTYITNPGTLEGHRKAGGIKPTYFDKKPSVINLAISDLVQKRSEYKKLKLKMIEERTNKGPLWESVVSDEIIVKELANSTYGIMGLEYGRYFSIDVAESITLFGHWAIYFAKSYFESLGYGVIYGDTDSVFVNTFGKEIDVEEVLKGYHISLKKELKEKYNIDESFIQLNFDKQYESFVIVAKKCYVGHVINMEGKKTDEIYGRGLDFIKKNTFGFASTKQKELIEIVLRGDSSKENIQNWMNGTKDEFFKRNFTVDELMITQKISKNPDEYKGTPPLQARLAKVLSDRTGQNLIGTEIEYVVTKMGENDKHLQGVLTIDFKGEFDRDYYWLNKTLPVLKRISDVVFPNIDFYPGPQLNLFS